MMVFHRGAFKGAPTLNELSTRIGKELAKLIEKQAAKPALSKDLHALQEAAMSLCLGLELFHEGFTWHIVKINLSCLIYKKQRYYLFMKALQ